MEWGEQVRERERNQNRRQSADSYIAFWLLSVTALLVAAWFVYERYQERKLAETVINRLMDEVGNEINNLRSIPYSEEKPTAQQAKRASKNVIINFRTPAYPIPEIGHPKEGIVHYAAYYTAMGYLKDVKIVKTSGHEILDRVVLNAIKPTARVDPYGSLKTDDVVVYFTCVFERRKVECGYQ